MCANKIERERGKEGGSGIRRASAYLIKQSALKALLCVQGDKLHLFPPQTGPFTFRTTFI